MNSKQASEIIGCHPTHVNWLCREGKLKCKEVPFKKGETGYRPGRTRWDRTTGALLCGAGEEERECEEGGGGEAIHLGVESSDRPRERGELRARDLHR